MCPLRFWVLLPFLFDVSFVHPSVRGHGAILDNLDDFRPKRLPYLEGKHELVEKYLDGSGRVRIKGSALLKGSQSYPRQ